MKLQVRKLASIGVICILLLVSFSTTALATTYIVTKKFIDSNEWTKITDVPKATTSAYASAYLTQFYKADGTATTDYDELYVKCGLNVVQAPSVLCQTGKIKQLSLYGTYQAAGTMLYFYGMGHDPALDCYISGAFCADYE